MTPPPTTRAIRTGYASKIAVSETASSHKVRRALSTMLPGDLRRLRGGQGMSDDAGNVAAQNVMDGELAAGLRIFCGTWNVNGKPPLVPIEDWLLTCSERDDVDVYVIALQEVQGLSGTAALLTDEEKGRPWSAVLQQAVGKSVSRTTIVTVNIYCT